MTSPLRIRGRTLLRRIGYDIVQRQPTIADVLRQRQINVVLDVGANEGQYAAYLRGWGYSGRIVSFEPIPAVYGVLRQAAAVDPLQTAVPHALGARDETATLHVSELSVFSSLREPLPSATAFDRRAQTVQTIEVPVRRLDDVFDTYVGADERAFLKVDAQGHEEDVLEGAQGVLDRVLGVQLELTTAALYEGETLAPAMIERMHSLGFRLAQMHPVVFDPADGNASLLQFDAVFVRPPLGGAS